jgi:hypothetical protein
MTTLLALKVKEEAGSREAVEMTELGLAVICLCVSMPGVVLEMIDW